MGKFDKEINLLDTNSDKVIYTIQGHVNGLTHVRFDPTNAHYLYSGARQDNLVYMWDLRNLSNFTKYFERESQTNQRMKFDITKDGKYIILGHTNGKISVHDINSEQIVYEFKEHYDTVNCVSCID